jgi:hypothetical protein
MSALNETKQKLLPKAQRPANNIQGGPSFLHAYVCFFILNHTTTTALQFCRDLGYHSLLDGHLLLMRII